MKHASKTPKVLPKVKLRLSGEAKEEKKPVKGSRKSKKQPVEGGSTDEDVSSEDEEDGTKIE
jgi:hypothetical protein